MTTENLYLLTSQIARLFNVRAGTALGIAYLNGCKRFKIGGNKKPRYITEFPIRKLDALRANYFALSAEEILKAIEFVPSGNGEPCPQNSTKASPLWRAKDKESDAEGDAPPRYLHPRIRELEDRIEFLESVMLNFGIDPDEPAYPRIWTISSVQKDALNAKK